VYLGVESFMDGERSWKFNTVGVLLSSMVLLSPVRSERCTPASVSPNGRCLVGLLLVFDSCFFGVCTLVDDDHLPGMLLACKKIYFYSIYKTIGDIVLE
jgi:hypothetical protein